MLKILVCLFLMVVATHGMSFDGNQNCYASHPVSIGDTSNAAYLSWTLDLYTIVNEIDSHFLLEMIKDEKQSFNFGLVVSVMCQAEKSDSIEEIVKLVIDAMKLE